MLHQPAALKPGLLFPTYLLWTAKETFVWPAGAGINPGKAGE